MFTQEKTFPVDLLKQGMTIIPNILLRFYPAMGITDSEMLIVIHIVRIENDGNGKLPLIEKLSSSMSASAENIKRDLAALIEKKLLTIEEEWDDNGNKKCETYILDGLYQRVYEIWCWEHSQSETAVTDQPAVQISLDDVALLVSTFEKEFGRLLSPFESDKIIDWYHGQSMPTGLILEALRRAVMRGIFNFSYIDSILRDWRKNNLRSLQDVMKLEEHKANKPKGRRKKSDEEKKDKYKDIYMS